MTDDPIVREIRAAHAAKFDNDLAKICADLRRRQAEEGLAGVTRPPKPAKGKKKTG